MFAPTGLATILKEGGKHLSGVQEATIKNIQACRELSNIARTSLGPNSMNKLIVTALEKHYVTSDAATILKELEVIHPAANLLVMAATMQLQEFGDATNLCVLLAGELLGYAETLLQQGISQSAVLKGYEAALDFAIKEIEGCVCWSLGEWKNEEHLRKALYSTISAKQFGLDDSLTALVAKAIAQVMPARAADFSVDNVRVAKITGGSLQHSHVVNGMVLTSDTHGSVKRKENAKVCVLGCGLEMTGTEAKGTVLLNTAEELKNFTAGEEARMEEMIKGIKDAGVEVIIAGGAISDIAQHFCNKYSILTVKVSSKFELRRICRTLGASALVRLGAPLPEEMGAAEIVAAEEISSQKVVIVKAKESNVATIVLRGATRSMLDEVERSIDHAVNCIKGATRDPRFVAGGGATELELARRLMSYGATLPGLEQYGVLKFAEALEAIPRIIAENAGQNATETVTNLYAAHEAGKKSAGVDIEGDSKSNIDCCASGILDHLQTKVWAVRLATDAALSVLRVDQIIMARPAGGPKPRDPQAPDVD